MYANTLFAVNSTPTGLLLRPYQSEIVRNCLIELNHNRSTLVVCPTGTGKSFALAQLAYEYAKKGKVLILAHKKDLISQLSGEIKTVTGHWPSLERAEHVISESEYKKAKYIVSTVQTQDSGAVRRFNKFNPNDFSLIICDEAHNFVNESSLRVLSHYQKNPNYRAALFTATPDRADGVSLRCCCESVAYNGKLKDFIDNGWLVKPVVKMIHMEEYDISMVGSYKGELNAKQLEEALSKESLIAALAYEIEKNANGEKTIVFCPGVTFAEMMTSHLNGINSGSAGHIFGHTNKIERSQTDREFKFGDIQFFVNVGVATEGYNFRGIKCIADCSPTGSRPRQTQKIGRGLRTLDGVIEPFTDDRSEVRLEAISKSDKPVCRVFDFYGNMGRHKLVSTIDILAGDDFSADAINLAKEKIKSNPESDITEALEEAEEQIIKSRHKSMTELCQGIRDGKFELKVKASYSEIDPFSLWDIPRADYLTSALKGRLATPEQIKVLKKYHIQYENLTFNQAKIAVSECIKLASIPTKKQMDCVKRMQIPKNISDKLQRNQIGRLIGIWKKHNFRTYQYWKKEAGLE